jgi:hypothetical protein
MHHDPASNPEELASSTSGSKQAALLSSALFCSTLSVMILGLFSSTRQLMLA